MTLCSGLEALLSLVFPAPCGLCGEGGHSGRLCDPCFESLPRSAGTAACAVCGDPFVAGALGLDRPGTRCADCLDGRAFARAVALGPLTGTLRELVLAVKFQGRQSLGFDLGRRAAAELKAALGPVDAVAAVPLGSRRRRERGYNQAAVVALGAAHGLRRPLLAKALSRTRETAAQTSLTRGLRRENVRGAFAARPEVKGRRVLLVDDVVTTGATAEESARALRRAGAAEVVVLALARAGRVATAEAAPEVAKVAASVR